MYSRLPTGHCPTFSLFTSASLVLHCGLCLVSFLSKMHFLSLVRWIVCGVHLQVNCGPCFQANQSSDELWHLPNKQHQCDSPLTLQWHWRSFILPEMIVTFYLRDSSSEYSLSKFWSSCCFSHPFTPPRQCLKASQPLSAITKFLIFELLKMIEFMATCPCL